ncbi:hypothetical protein [Clostridium sp.]|uniref:hypothetical protein n=1 Tax=Clostridium sp. TaxID=1506 RepID=UPI002621824A|nr:hypothetical protein [Clostridium sp.]
MSIRFATSLLFFWIKGEISVDNRFVKTNLSNTILGFIPAGKDNQSIPLKNISSATTSTKFKIKAIIGGLILILLGLGSFSDSFLLGLILLVIGIGILGSGINILLIIEKAGNPYIISVPFFESSKIMNLKNMIDSALSNDTDKTDLNMFFDKKSI